MSDQEMRGRKLHNFVLPKPKWGRCRRRVFATKNQEPQQPQPQPAPPPPAPSTTSDHVKLSKKKDKKKKKKFVVEEDTDEDDDEESIVKEWNLRPRPNSNQANVIKKMNLSISLNKSEIEQDFIAMTGSKPPKVPKKRNKKQQNQFDVCPLSLSLACF